MESEHPEIFVLGGPNGAGKTSVAKRILPDSDVLAFINADFIARGISPHSPESTAFEAGRLMLKRLRELRGARETFGFETTLASRTFATFLREAQASGYLVHVIYACLSDPDLAVHRVRLRVLRGGHDIPEETVRRRYARSLTNFFQLYRPLADGWSVWDNSGRTLLPLARGTTSGETIVLDPVRWARVKEQGATDAG